MRVVKVYEAGDSVEAHFLCQELEEEGIECQIVGEHIESLYGLTPTWNRPSILVAEDDEERARAILAARLQLRPQDPQPAPKLQYGMRALLINVTLIAVTLGFYEVLESGWPGSALLAFQLLIVGNLLAFAYAHLWRRSMENSTRSPETRPESTGGPEA